MPKVASTLGLLFLLSLTLLSLVRLSDAKDPFTGIVVMNSDGSGQTRLIFDRGDDWGPDWSPDGSKIIFQGRRDSSIKIFVVNADGFGEIQLTFGVGIDWSPRWSPDSKKIVFTSDRTGNDEIYVMNANGSGVIQLTHNPASDGPPSWSPDGKRIVFDSDRDGDVEIFVMNVDGSGQTQLTFNKVLDTGPQWSPDGRRIAFYGGSSCGTEYYCIAPSSQINDAIFVMNADGSGQTQLTHNPADDTSPNWSPDGKKISFTSDRDGDQEIYVMNADGSRQTRLTFNQGNDLLPDWSPDGTKIAFSSQVTTTASATRTITTNIVSQTYPAGTATPITTAQRITSIELFHLVLSDQTLIVIAVGLVGAVIAMFALIRRTSKRTGPVN